MMNLIKEEIKDLMTQMNYSYENKYADIQLNEDMNIYLFLCEAEDIIADKSGKSSADVLYSEYYWFTKFKTGYETKYGEDAGIDQIQYGIIEEIEQISENGVDWEKIQEIENEVMTGAIEKK